MKAAWYIYLIRCQDGSLYTGITTNVARRLSEHRGGGKKGAKYLRGRGPLAVAFQKKLAGKSQALRVERLVKMLPKARKEELIKTASAFSKIVRQVNRPASA
jgi:putative endonuclease